MQHSHAYSQRRLSGFVPVLCALAGGLAAQAAPPPPGQLNTEGLVKQIFGIEQSGGRSVDRLYVISPDSTTLAYCESAYDAAGKPPHCELILVDLATGKELQRRRADDAYGGVFSPDGKLLAVGTPNCATAVTVWDVARWEPKVQLKRPDGHVFGQPLAISPDGKFVAGRIRRTEDKQPPSFTDDLVLWDMETGACRVLADRGAKRMRWVRRKFAGAMPTVFLEDGLGEAKWPAPPGTPIVGCAPLAATFPDSPGSDQLFVDYGDFVTVWDTARGKALSTDFTYGTNLWRSYSESATIADLFRFRRAPSGRILELPKYDPPPLTAYCTDQGTIVLAATPIEKSWGYRTPCASFPFTELCRLDDYRGGIGGPIFQLSPDGRRLLAFGAEGGKGKTVEALRVWDVSALHPIARAKMQQLTGAERERLWTHLFDDYADPEKTDPIQYSLQYQAMFSLLLHGEDAVPWLRQKMGPPIDVTKAPQWVQDLDSDDFDTRERASRELDCLGPLARPFLERALAKGPSGETKRRAGDLLKKLEKSADSYELRQMRIIDVLENVDSSAAQELLQQIADGKYDPAFATEAKAALRRAAEKR